MCDIVIGGIYTHYKNKKQYKVIAIAKHSETLEQLVVYQALYDNNQVWCRPLHMFCEQVELEGVISTRFILEKRKDYGKF